VIDSADVAIIGGGAAGLTAAIFAAQSAALSRRIVLLDSAKTLGAKILVSGGGRCNVTHDLVRPEDYNGPRNIVRNVLAAFDAQAAVRWFASLGVELKREETGKLFPTTDSARTVLAALLRRCDELKVVIQTASRVRRIEPPASAETPFVIHHDGGSLSCKRLIMATGGRSLPRSGSDGSGWEIVKQLGHTVTPTFAALVPLVLDATMFHASLSGISQEVELSTFVEGKRIDRRAGSLLWTHFGISGPVVMDASRHWVIARESAKSTRMVCNFLPAADFASVEKWLIDAAAARPQQSLANLLSARLPERVALALLTHCSIDPTSRTGQLPRDSRRTLVHAITALDLKVVQQRGWNYAEVTAGGVPLSEVDYRTMESRKVPRLHLVGEMLDCDGRIGGFNFQWAWASGKVAGTALAR
jgi:predicted Rossmann fold flavoprotein